jgi:hypothetical protein
LENADAGLAIVLRKKIYRPIVAGELSDRHREIVA